MSKISDLNRENIELISTALDENNIKNLNDLLLLLASGQCGKEIVSNSGFNWGNKLRHSKNGMHCEIFLYEGEFNEEYPDYYDAMVEFFCLETKIIEINFYKSGNKKENFQCLLLKFFEFKNLLRIIKISTLYS